MLPEAPDTPIAREGDSSRHSSWLRAVGLLTILLSLLIGNFFVRRYLEPWPHQSYFTLTKASLAPLKRKPWKALLPIDIGGGQRWFATTSLLVVEGMNAQFTPGNAFLILNGLAIIASFITSWLVFRSAIFTISFTLCIAFGTQLHYAYALSGTFVLYLQIVYLEVCLLCMLRVLTSERHVLWWKIGFVLSLIVFAIGFDTWYNFLAFVWVAGPLLWIYFARRGEREKLSAIRFIVVATTLVACVHLPIKLLNSGQHFATGREDELLFNYKHRTLMVEDFVSNIFTYLYISLTNFAPSFLISSNSAYRLGTSVIIAEQHGYDSGRSHLVAMHHLFLWYYYAGIAVTIYLYFLVRSTVRAIRDQSVGDLKIAIILVGILTGAGTHLLIKYRPYMSVPSLSYKCMPSILATAVLIAYWLMTLKDKIQTRWVYALCVGLAWVTILYGGLTRPRALSYLNEQVGLGRYPDPVQNLRTLISAK
jgi:hypothetical protein